MAGSGLREAGSRERVEERIGPGGFHGLTAHHSTERTADMIFGRRHCAGEHGGWFAIAFFSFGFTLPFSAGYHCIGMEFPSPRRGAG